ncbi:MAG: hypothetical protein ACHQ1D_04180 [Nitrososphaerales archaeon]
MTKYQDLLKKLEQVTVKAKKIIPEMCSCLGIEDPTLSDEEIKDRVKKDVIALGFSAEYVSQCIPKELKDQNKADSGRKGAHATNQLFKQGENVTGNVAAIKAANPEFAKVVEKHTEDTRSFIKVRSPLYLKLESVAVGAIRNKSPLILIEYEGDQAKDVFVSEEDI